MRGDDSTILYPDPTLGQRASGIPAFVGGHNGDVVYRPSPNVMPASAASRQC
ncbi:MAG TPA: hypothetical protein VNS22_12960 [Geminicoccus sp.]|uniref:hypothetical protein n=1 Tax=Geminicoccus sp. TaxID=2024832 RepID=UPI002B84617D|nr:hypothetical protein [Geminicoccus sp.]HWL69283.1 hypothetical protein [Geminicoccus sp.]